MGNIRSVRENQRESRDICGDKKEDERVLWISGQAKWGLWISGHESTGCEYAELINQYAGYVVDTTIGRQTPQSRWHTPRMVGGQNRVRGAHTTEYVAQQTPI